jgi:hypothetical protein
MSFAGIREKHGLCSIRGHSGACDMSRILISIAILVGLYYWMAHISTAEAAAGITLMAAAFLVTFLGLSRG